MEQDYNTRMSKYSHTRTCNRTCPFEETGLFWVCHLVLEFQTHDLVCLSMAFSLLHPDIVKSLTYSHICKFIIKWVNFEWILQNGTLPLCRSSFDDDLCTICRCNRSKGFAVLIQRWISSTAVNHGNQFSSDFFLYLFCNSKTVLFFIINYINC